MHQGIAHVLRDVLYRKDHRVRPHIIIRWRPDLPKQRDEPWYLRTTATGGPRPSASSMPDA